MAKKRATKTDIKYSFTNTKGQKVTALKGGTTTRTGGLPATLQSTIDQADKLGIDTTEARGVLGKEKGYEAYAGSSYKANEKKKEPVILSTENAKNNFQANIMPTITKANEGLGNLGLMADEEAKSKAETDPVDPLIKQEYDANLSDEEKESQDYISSLTRQADAVTKAYDQMSVAAAASAKASIRSLRKQYEERKGILEQQNQGEQKAWQQQFIRSGQAEYSPGMTSSFLTAKEQEGQQKISELNDLWMSKVDEVNAALEEKQYSNAALKAKEIQTIEAEMRKEVKAMRDEARKENKAILERFRLATVGSMLSDAINQGITDRSDLFNHLSAANPGGFTPEEFDKTMDALLPQGTGVIGEYEYYKREAQRNGQTPLSFDEYQTRDANRKRSITQNIIGGSGLNTKETTIFNSLVDKYNKSPLVMANDRASILRDTTAALKNDPTNPSLQVSFIYSFIQALDTYQSAVREGEIALLQGTQGLVDKIQNIPNQIEKGTPLEASVILNYAATADMLSGSINKAAGAKQRAFQTQANINGTNVGSAFEEYATTISSASTAGEVMQTEEQAEARLDELYTGGYQAQIDTLIQQYPSMSASDLLQVLGV